MNFLAFLANGRVALALIAFLGGAMGFVESTAAAPSASTALLADALPFISLSVEAAVVLWGELNLLKRRPWMIQLVGAIMTTLGLGVLVVAIARARYPVTPLASVMAVFAFTAIIITFVLVALTRARKKLPLSVAMLWRDARADIAGHLSVILAAIIVTLTHNGIADIAVGGAGASLVTYAGWKTMRSGATGLDSHA